MLCVVVYKELFFVHSPIKHKFLKDLFNSSDGTLTDIATLGQSEPVCNGNNRVLNTFKSWSLTLKYSLVS